MVRNKPILCVEPLKREDLAWAAGFFDGEGCVMFRGRKRREISISIAQADKEPLERFHRAVRGVGRVRGPYRTSPHDHHRPVWVFATHGFKDTQAVIAMLWAFLSGPKRDQAVRAIAAAVPHYRERHEMGKGRAKLTRAQAAQLRIDHAAARVGRQRVPKGFFASMEEKLGVKAATISSICQGFGYAD